MKLNDWSPWMRALMYTGEATTTPEQQAAQTPEQPSTAAPPAHRIADDQTAGTRGTTPQSPTTIPTTGRAPGDSTGFYAGASHPQQLGAASLPLERQLTTDRAEMERLNQPSKPPTLGQRIGRGVLGAIEGAGGMNQINATLRDRAAARKMQEREDLANRIAANTRSLSEEGIRAQAQVASAQRLGETLRSRESIADANREGAMSRAELEAETRQNITDQTLGQKGTQFEEKRGDQLAQFQSTDEYRRWKERLDTDTKLRVAQMRINATQNKAPAAMMQTAVFAKGGLDRLGSAEQAMQRLQQSGVMGQDWAQNKLEDWIFGKGAVDPQLTPQQRQDIGQLRAALGFTSSAAMRAHTGRTSKEIYDDFKSRLGPGQDWDALRGAMQETHSMLYEYATSASDASIASIRGGTNVTPGGGTSAAPQPGQATHRWTPKGIVPAGQP